MVMTMIKVNLPDRSREVVLDALKSFSQFTEISSGCICCKINRDVINHDTILYLEEWQNREDLERHIQSRKYRELLEIIEQSMGKPEINFLTVSKIEGLELIQKLRRKT